MSLPTIDDDARLLDGRCRTGIVRSATEVEGSCSGKERTTGLLDASPMSDVQPKDPWTSGLVVEEVSWFRDRETSAQAFAPGFPAVCGIPRRTPTAFGWSPGLFTVKSRSLPRHPLRGSRTGIAACSVVESRPSGRSRRSRNCRGMSKSGNLGIPDGKTRRLGSVLRGLPVELRSGLFLWATRGTGRRLLGDIGVPECTNLGRRRVGSEFPRSGFAVDDGGRRGIGRLLPAWRRQRIGHGIAVKAGERQ